MRTEGMRAKGNAIADAMTSSMRAKGNAIEDRVEQTHKNRSGKPACRDGFLCGCSGQLFCPSPFARSAVRHLHPSPFARSARILLMLILCFLPALTACGSDKDKQIVLTTGFGADEVFRLEGETCTKQELLVYMMNLHGQYDNIFGEGIWDTQIAGVPLQDYIKRTAVARLYKLKMMNLLAKSYQTELTPEEEKKTKEAAKEFMSGLGAEDMARAGGLKQNMVQRMYGEYRIAEKLYLKLIENVNPEISDDEARTITVRQVYCKDKDTLADMQARLEEGEDFDTLSFAYNEKEDYVISFPKGRMDKNVEDVCFMLAEGEISDIVAADEGYYLFKCLSTYDSKQTELSKEEILRKRRKEAFSQVYENFSQGKECYLNEELLNSLMESELRSGGSDFFVIYEKYFPGE